MEVVNLRVRATGKIAGPPLPLLTEGGADPGRAFLEARLVYLQAGPQAVPLYRGELLAPGNRLSGPTLIVRADTSILVDRQDRAEVDAYGNVLIQVSGLDG